MRWWPRWDRSWLEDIPDGRIQPSGLPLTVLTLVHRALGSAGGSARTQVRTRSGRWLTLHVELADGGAADAGPPPPSGRVSLVVEPSRPQELAEVIADAYGLTPREGEVARLVGAGHTNREISSTLWLSACTVQDHLKAVYAKLGVRNRSELAARMFLDQYLPRLVDGTPLGGNGWYVTGDTAGPAAHPARTGWFTGMPMCGRMGDTLRTRRDVHSRLLRRTLVS